MARVSGMKEKLHMPLYDAFFVPGEKNGTQAARFEEKLTDPRLLRFFVDVQNKTRLETNLQAAGVLPSLNSFEARALRVVVSSVSRIKRRDGDIEELSDGVFLAELIYNSVTSLLVGEKIMIEIPTFWFPSGAGVSPGNRNVTNHGEPDPMATFRFAEPVFIESQQNFRVEMSFPHDVPQVIKDTLGPLRIWVVLDGYLTRDVQ
jgi:hypothetical protein